MRAACYLEQAAKMADAPQKKAKTYYFHPEFHPKFKELFPPKTAKKIVELKSELKAQQSLFVRPAVRHKAATEA